MRIQSGSIEDFDSVLWIIKVLDKFINKPRLSILITYVYPNVGANMIPLILRLKKQVHRDVAKAQDLVVETLYRKCNGAVLHGGTAIWRCYQGNRFSEDIDVYLSKNLPMIESFFSELEKKGFTVEKKKITEKSLYSTLMLGRTSVRFEAVFKEAKSALKEYEMAEGNLITVNTLSPADLVREKLLAYRNRGLVRDVYDIFFLLRYVEDISQLRNDLLKFIKEFTNPVDEPELKVLILEGLVPSTRKMIEYIRGKSHNGEAKISR